VEEEEQSVVEQAEAAEAGASTILAPPQPKRKACVWHSEHVFDQMNTSWEKLVQYVGTNYGQDISNEIQNKVRLTIPKPTYSAAIMTKHAQREALIRQGQANLLAAREKRRIQLEAAVSGNKDAEAPM
jgi:hypothetical protein